ncbi:hypothetical protein B0T24DRAFT_229583 [Lasiosphaeria ovina]|uniref:Uncharacterized protein n=1 Tax=Lasiosphaeria ovina TaxID=92902 RepID=A0AAE0KHQ4_9PEZI|nr:hypothetical protein B0T24DRAFT_229583 [Lasiosphaeria ovina]
MYAATTVLALATLASTVSATLNINNWCNVPVYVYQSNCGSCDKGSNDACNQSPYVIGAGNGGSILRLDWIRNNCGTSVKISKNDPGFNSGILQFEYTYASGDGLYWDVSNIDGAGAGRAGTPFYHDNVKATPTDAGAGQGTCQKIRCPANQLCVDAYNHPDDVRTRWCPLNTGDMWLDLCEPTEFFNNKRELPAREARRAIAFTA